MCRHRTTTVSAPSLSGHVAPHRVSAYKHRVRTAIKKRDSIIFQYIPGWIELNFQDISGAVYHTNKEINILSRI